MFGVIGLCCVVLIECGCECVEVCVIGVGVFGGFDCVCVVEEIG